MMLWLTGVACQMAQTWRLRKLVDLDRDRIIYPILPCEIKATWSHKSFEKVSLANIFLMSYFLYFQVWITEESYTVSSQSIRAALDFFGQNSSSGVKLGAVQSIEVSNTGEGMGALEKGKDRMRSLFDCTKQSLKAGFLQPTTRHPVTIVNYHKGTEPVYHAFVYSLELLLSSCRINRLQLSFNTLFIWYTYKRWHWVSVQ